METLHVGCEEEVAEPGGVGLVGLAGLAGLAEGRTSEHLGTCARSGGVGGSFHG